MFRRSRSETATTTTTSGGNGAPARPGTKGRPTPTRKEAEAAARARAKKAPGRKEKRAAARRDPSGPSSREIRDGIKRGEEKYLPARDRGPVRRFIRDFVDARFSVLELMVPLMVVTLVLGYSGNPRLVEISSNIMLGAVLLVILDSLILKFRLGRELSRRFPDEEVKRPTLYAVMRALQMRFLRLPKPQVTIGQELSGRYR